MLECSTWSQVQKCLSVKKVGSRLGTMFFWGVIWVKTVCKPYQQVEFSVAGEDRVKEYYKNIICLMQIMNKSRPFIYYTLCIHILKRKRNATLSNMVVPSFSSKKSASDNEIAKYRYLPCKQHQNQTAVTYGWRAATKNVRQPPLSKSQRSKL